MTRRMTIIRHNQKFVPGGGGIAKYTNRLHDGMSFLFLPCFFSLPVCVTHMTHTDSKMCKKCAAVQREETTLQVERDPGKGYLPEKYRQTFIVGSECKFN
jgi:hypothetical protein